MAATEQMKSEMQTEKAPVSTKKKEKTFSFILVLIILISILISTPLVLIRFNLIGAADILRPVVGDINFFKKLLPPLKDLSKIEYMNREQLYQILVEEKKKTEQLQNQLNENKKIAEKYVNNPNGFEQFINDKKALEKREQELNMEIKELEQNKNEFWGKVAMDSPRDFKSYFEGMDSIAAKEIYRQVMEKEKLSTEVKDFISYYENMDSASATRILEKLAEIDINLVTNILKNMEKSNASKILQTMDVNLASRISDILARQTPIN